MKYVYIDQTGKITGVLNVQDSNFRIDLLPQKPIKLNEDEEDVFKNSSQYKYNLDTKTFEKIV